ncbi:MarR family winged helix-turn-helix transcriptional regulator [Peptostreptococcus canis]|uniref:Winged helix-turn-helix transcriptional regulator n=1 Tax=Peptostreptococcus canis TaxID=1159213 RepID=A0ABR6TMU3_9FIRM|nr:MarR family winged helix-turn-helix transcriptional regulator [Peptostreptococcus canis]MBC2576734.1 winged helix-turn-helix transcriptional regulator [Peptostreptococcus canis]MBP1998833.1 DNA-binding MarR family transcriptional regulator [Peptostreptococcus canis]
MYNNVDMTISFMVKSLPKIYNDFYLEYIKSFMQTTNINKTQVRAITFIKNYGSISMSELCNMLNIEKGSLTSMIDDLEEKKYVERTKDRRDRRKYNIVLTEKGDKLAQDFVEYLKESLKGKIDKIGNENLQHFFDAMNVIIKTVEEISK